MKRTFLALLAGLVIAPSAYAAAAYWTGKQEMVQSVTGQMVWRCEYNYNGQMVYFLFKTSCPSSVEVE
jgi:hypothetical protein